MLRSVSVLSRIHSRSFSRIQAVRRRSMEAGRLLYPKFVQVEQTGISSISQPEGHKFTVVSYNILAQAYVKSSYFPHSPSASLRWKARSQAVIDLLKHLGTDFLCLQEVDEYESFYRATMEKLGYSSIYIKRNGKKRDGCGIFYKQGSADLVLQENIEYNDLVKSIKGESENPPDGSTTSISDSGDKTKDSVQETAEDRGDPNDPCVRLKRDCVGIMGAFRLKDHYVIVANTHIYWDPDWIDVKLAQARYLLSRLARFKTTVSERFDCSPSVIVTGDFNSTPGDQVYQYLISGSLSSSLSSPVDFSEEMPTIPLRSVYGETRGEPPFTNCTPGFTGTLDYIFLAPCGSIKPISFLDLPGSNSPSVDGGLPNLHHPSDHLPIGAEFEVGADR